MYDLSLVLYREGRSRETSILTYICQARLHAELLKGTCCLVEVQIADEAALYVVVNLRAKLAGQISKELTT